MAIEEFLDNLRTADRLMQPPATEADAQTAAILGRTVEGADLWLTARSVGGYHSVDFRDWPETERKRLDREVDAFLALAQQVPPDKPATRAQSREAQRHLTNVIEIVRARLLPDWLLAQRQMVDEARAAASAEGWYVEQDDKKLTESLLGSYEAPRLRIRTKDSEVVLDPIARFGSGRRGIVDLVVLPTYETAYVLTFQNGAWEIVAPRGSLHSRPFNRRTLANTISRLSQN